MKTINSYSLLAVMILSLCLLSCGGGSNGSFTLSNGLDDDPARSSRPVDPPAALPDKLEMLTSKLETELLALGKDISSTTSEVPSGSNAPVDVQAVILDADGNGSTPPYGVQLRWVERLLGDYDQNGEVNLADLSVLARYFNYNVEYDAPELHNGVESIPAGDPDDFGVDSDGINPQPDSGAFNWRLSRIDGDGNGEIGLSDITVLALHWGESLSGYIVYRQGPGEADFSPMPNTQWPESPMTLRRFDVIEALGDEWNNKGPISYSVPDFYLLDDPSLEYAYTYKIAPYNTEAGLAGPETSEIVVSPFNSEQPNGGIIPSLSVSIETESGTLDLGNPVAIQGTVPLTVTLNASASYVPDGGLVNYLWDFDGDGIFEASTGENPETTHTYTDNARFNATVKLIRIEDEFANGDSSQVSFSTGSANATVSVKIVTLNLSGNQPPHARCLADRTFGAIPLTVNFDASTSSDEDSSIEFYEWDFDGDGTTDYASTTPSATFTFGTPSLSKVRIKVIDEEGGYDTLLIPVITSNPDGDWPPSAEMLINPTLGSAPLNVMIDGSGSLDPDGSIVSYEWDLNGDFTFDINTGTNSVFDYTFTDSGIYNVWLKVTDSAGQFDLARTLVNVNTAPFIGLEAIPESGPGPLTVTFDASSSEDLDGSIVKYEWDFDTDGVIDRDTGILPRVTHTFYRVGTIVVTLRITDNLGFTSSQGIEIEVIAPQNNLTPTIALAANVTDGAPPMTVTLTATAADPDVDGGIDHYDWDYEGDGIYDESTDILGTVRVHEYAAAGRFNPTVRVVDVAGGSATASVEVLVHQPGNDPPVADFVVNPVGSPPGLPITLDASTSTDDTGIATYAWDFEGDGTFEVSGTAVDAQIVEHTYMVLGTYVAILMTTDDDGAVDYAWQQIIVGNVPELTIVTNRDYAEVPGGKFSLDASRSIGMEGAITSFEWDLDGDGTFEISTGVSPFVEVEFRLEDLLLYPGGLVNPRLRATNEIGASAITNVIKMPARDPLTGEPLRDANGNLVLDETGQVLLEEVDLTIQDNYDEVEDNDEYLTANFLVGPAGDGTFSPAVAGDTMVAIRYSRFLGDDIALTRIHPQLGNYVAGSLGELNLGDIYDGDDEDWYAFELSEGAHVRVDMVFLDKSKTDFNLRLYAANGSTPVAQSLTIDNDETINYDFRDPGVYYIKVNRFVGEGQDYILVLETTPINYFPEGTVTARWDNGTKDADVNHDVGGDAVVSAGLADDFQTTILDPKLAYAWGSVDKVTDPEDWYYFNYSSPITVRVICGFSHSQADVDIFLYDENLSLLGYSNTADDNELIWRPLPDPVSPKRIFVRVVAYGGGNANYTLSIGYPAGSPRNLVASDGSTTGRIDINWQGPAPGGNSPNGYSLFVSDSELGYYTLLADQLTATTFTHDLSASQDVPLHNQAFYYKVKATITGQQDSEFSNIDSGYCNDVKAPFGLDVSDSLFLDHVQIRFYDSPSDPDLGTGNFGLPPLRYEVYADPTGSLPDTRIATFYPGDGEETLVPQNGTRDGEVFEFDWTGLPLWNANQLRGVSTAFRVVAYNYNDYLSPADQTGEDTDTGAIASLPAPTDLTATDGLFPDQTRVSWEYNSSMAPDSFILQFKGEYDTGWTDVTPQPIPFVSGKTNYDYYVTGASGAPDSGYYIIRAQGGGGFSPYSEWNYGWASDNGLLEPSNMNWWTEAHGTAWDVKVELGSPPFGSIVPRLWSYDFYEVAWRGWSPDITYWREFSSNIHTYHWEAATVLNLTRKVHVMVFWDIPGDQQQQFFAYYTKSKTSGQPVPRY